MTPETSAVANARFADPDGRSILALMNGVQVAIPADPGNADYKALLASGAEIAPFRRWDDLAAAKAALGAEIEAEASRRRTAVVGSADPAKLAVYQHKAELAASGEAGLAALAPEAAARGLAAEDLALVILMKAEIWRTAGLAIDAAAERHKAAVAALGALEAAEAYDVGAGWPPG